MDYIAQQTEKVKNREFTLINAFSVALNIEKAIIDGKIFEPFKEFSKDAKGIIRDLGNAVLHHYRVIEKAWAEHRQFV